MYFKLIAIWLALAVLVATTNHSRADQTPQIEKTRADQIQKVFEAFWTTESTQPVKIPPTMSNVHYGEDKKQVLDFWQAKSDKPTPLVFFIHGGAWKSNDKDKVILRCISITRHLRRSARIRMTRRILPTLG